jgi:hypothetical protein
MSAAWLAAALAVATAPAPTLPQAAPGAVHSRLTSSTPRLGEPFDWEIEVRHPPGEAYALPGRLDLAPFQVQPLGCRRAPLGQEVLTTCALRLTLFELGGHDVPGLRLEVATPAGPQVLDVPGPRVEAAGVIDPRAPAEQLQLRDPAGPVPLLLPSWRVVWWSLGALLAALAAWRAWRWWRGRAARAAEPPPPVPPDVRLARRLDALAAERLPEQGLVREYFFRLSEAVREYLGALTGVNALDLTTAELGDALAALGDPRLDLAALRGFLEDADLVKFARFPAGGAECQAGMVFARGLLASTSGGPTATLPAGGPPGPAGAGGADPGRSPPSTPGLATLQDPRGVTR